MEVAEASHSIDDHVGSPGNNPNQDICYGNLDKYKELLNTEIQYKTQFFLDLFTVLHFTHPQIWVEKAEGSITFYLITFHLYILKNDNAIISLSP